MAFSVKTCIFQSLTVRSIRLQAGGRNPIFNEIRLKQSQQRAAMFQHNTSDCNHALRL